MATLSSAAVTAMASGKVRPSAYRGNVQCIPVEISTDAADGTHAVVFSETLPPNTELVAISLEHTAIGGTTNTLDIGVTGNADAIIDGADVSAAGVITYPAEAGTTTVGAGAPIAVGGLQIIGELKGTMSTDTINGYILVVSDE